MLTEASEISSAEPARAERGADLILSNVAVSRAGRPVLAGVSFELAPGEAIILKGANGSGKTTLLRAVAGLLPIEDGRIEICSDGKRLGDVDDRRRFTIHCGHADAVKAAMSARENLSFWARLYGAPSSRIDQALETFALRPLAEARASNLSAGQRRRLGLARLVVAGKPIWLLDEPTASMDAASSKRLVALIEDHLRSGGSALIATHDLIDITGAKSFVLELREAA
ncbi:MAG TPA: heme ABC exporter ATP-binding protein CcmA [Parvularculaceae bacterium]|nr:heme ABC exporter ATP-binding protein CcmA [Parvularculaceae bacterium]